MHEPFAEWNRSYSWAVVVGTHQHAVQHVHQSVMHAHRPDDHCVRGPSCSEPAMRAELSTAGMAAVGLGISTGGIAEFLQTCHEGFGVADGKGHTMVPSYLAYIFAEIACQ
jgi:hypothetical protein